MSNIILEVPDVSCAHCEKTILNALGQQPGVQSVQVDIPAKVVYLGYDPATLPLTQVQAILDEEGYPVVGTREGTAPRAAPRRGHSTHQQVALNMAPARGGRGLSFSAAFQSYSIWPMQLRFNRLQWAPSMTGCRRRNGRRDGRCNGCDAGGDGHRARRTARNPVGSMFPMVEFPPATLRSLGGTAASLAGTQLDIIKRREYISPDRARVRPGECRRGTAEGSALGVQAFPTAGYESWFAAVCRTHSTGSWAACCTLPGDHGGRMVSYTVRGMSCAMSTQILTTKLYIPPPPPHAILRPRLAARLNAGLHGKLTLISAPAGFGKTTLVSAWVVECAWPVAWLSLDAGDSDPTRFLTYLVAALQTIAAPIGAGAVRLLQSPQPPPPESILTALLNDIATLPDPFVLILDDYHVIDAPAVDQILTFLLEYLPPQMRLVIATREDPQIPLARLRGGGQLTELRVADLRFTPAEAAGFLNQAMGLNLAADSIAALETRTEGWIAGLQLAAILLQGQHDTAEFIQSFTGRHHFVMDYLVEEVLQQQSASVQTFLLRTSILERLCGSLCDAVLHNPATSGQDTLEYIEHANLFIIPLDNERRWYRYHHLFADLLRQRLHQQAAASAPEDRDGVAALHRRASQWYEDQGLVIEAFHHAVAAHDIERAERLIEGQGIPLHLRGAVTTILDWLGSLPPTVLDARPSLWWWYAALLLVSGQTTGVAEKLDAAEAALPANAADDTSRQLIGRIATARATLALTHYQADTMLAESRRALEYLPPQNLSLRANAHWTLGFAYLLLGDRAAARQAHIAAIALSQAAGDIFTTILATIGLGQVQELANQLDLAADTYRGVLQLAGDQPLQIINEAHLGLARVLYEWNDLAAAEQHGRQSLDLARQYDQGIDRFIISELFLARLQLAQGDVAGAATLLAQIQHAAQRKNFVQRLPEVAEVQVLVLLRQGHTAAAAQLTQLYNLPRSQARVHLAQRDPTAALAVLEPLLRQAEANFWEDERLKVLVLQALALFAQGEPDRALHRLGAALGLAELGGFRRLFLDEGLPMAQLLAAAATRGIQPAYTHLLLAAFAPEQPRTAGAAPSRLASPVPPLIEPLSPRELEVLHLIAQGLSNRAISARLFLALDTVKGHNQKIFGKLTVQRRTEAVARARELGLL